MADSVSIIGGSGALGFGLAARLATAGIPVIIGSRNPERAVEAAGRVLNLVPGASVTGVGNEEAGAASKVVILAVPFRNQSETLTNLRPVMREGQLLSVKVGRSRRVPYTALVTFVERLQTIARDPSN